MRVGIIAKLIEDRKFGFIETDHFRDDVFFHQSCLEGLTFKRLYVGQEVEFEINEILRMDEDKLEATIVKASSIPLSKSVDDQPQRGMRASHHPRARQRKPSWKKNPNAPGDGQIADDNSANGQTVSNDSSVDSLSSEKPTIDTDSSTASKPMNQE